MFASLRRERGPASARRWAHPPTSILARSLSHADGGGLRPSPPAGPPPSNAPSAALASGQLGGVFGPV